MEVFRNLWRKLFVFTREKKVEVVKEEAEGRKRQLNKEVVTNDSVNHPATKRPRMADSETSSPEAEHTATSPAQTIKPKVKFWIHSTGGGFKMVAISVARLSRFAQQQQGGASLSPQHRHSPISPVDEDGQDDDLLNYMKMKEVQEAMVNAEKEKMESIEKIIQTKKQKLHQQQLWHFDHQSQPGMFDQEFVAKKRELIEQEMELKKQTTMMLKMQQNLLVEKKNSEDERKRLDEAWRAVRKRRFNDGKLEAHEKESYAGGINAKSPTMYVGQQKKSVEGELRPIVIDGSNVAMSHGLNTAFSARGIELVVKYFSARGHEKIVAFVPQFRNKPTKSTDRELLEQLHKSGNLVYTPSREVGNTRITSYDDTFILEYAAMHGGVVVTRDNYRDLALEKKAWLEVVKNRILMPTFVGNDLMFPYDPLGRSGPTLDRFLRF